MRMPKPGRSSSKMMVSLLPSVRDRAAMFFAVSFMSAPECFSDLGRLWEDACCLLVRLVPTTDSGHVMIFQDFSAMCLLLRLLRFKKRCWGQSRHWPDV